jgi:hypothetical protein
MRRLTESHLPQQRLVADHLLDITGAPGASLGPRA